ncbi:MAG: ATP-grasp domain-containing protein [Candidatus Bathyarchaeia archaeon]
MRLYENEAKQLFRDKGIPVPRQYGIIHSALELEGLNAHYPLILKALVLVGGRGKAGGIKKAKNQSEAKAKAEEIFKQGVKDYPAKSLLVEEAVDELAACYIGTTMDPATFNNVVIASATGGVDVETVARDTPEAIHRIEVSGNESKLAPSLANELARQLIEELPASARAIARTENLAEIISKVYSLYQEADTKICEINPLIITPKGPVAADAKIVLDDNALYRQEKLLDSLGITDKRHDAAESTANERKAQANGFKYVDLLPEDAPKDLKKIYVGLVPGGAGYGIFSIDEVANIGNRFFQGRVIPVDFMDSGGGPSQRQVAQMFHLLMDYDKVELIITSRFGGISSCDVFIRGLVEALRERHAQGKKIIPVYGRMVGTDLPSAREYLEKAKAETPEALKEMTIIVGNQRIMADVIKDAINWLSTAKREK